MQLDVIVHVYDSLHPRSGGPPQVIFNLARAQQKRGAHIRFISCDAGDAEVRALIYEELGSIDLIELKPRGLRPFFSRVKIDQALQGASTVHLHSIWPTPNLFVAHRCIQQKIPYVLSIHGHLRREALAIKATKKRIGLALGYRAMLQNASVIHALTQSEAQEVLDFGLTAPCHVIPNGVIPPSSSEKPTRELLLNFIPRLNSAPYLLFLSRIHPPKGALHLAQAFVALSTQYPELHLVIAGPDFGGVAEVVDEIEKAQLSDRVHLPGLMIGEVKSAILAHATAFCLPSHHEGFSVAVLESLAWGAPTVISSACHFPELADAEAGWVHEVGTEPLIEVLSEILRSPRQAQERALHGQKWVKTRYHWEEIERQFQELYALSHSHVLND